MSSLPPTASARPAVPARRSVRDAIGLLALLALLGASAALARDASASTFWALWAIALLVTASLGVAFSSVRRRCARLERTQLADNHAAMHDPLTGVANRRHFEQRLSAMLDDPAPAHALLMIDLDRFKPVNDLYGHAAGDALLRDIAAGIARCVSGDDLVARLGGDEFALLLHDTDADSAQRTALQVLDGVLRYRLTWEGQRISVGTSIGLVTIDASGGTPSELLAAADTALYAAKEAGRGAVFRCVPAAAPDGSPCLQRVDAGAPVPVPSARSHEPEDGRRQELQGYAIVRPDNVRPAPASMRQGSRRRRELAHRIAVEPVTVGESGSPGMRVRELLDDAAARADGGADLARWVMGMTLDAASRMSPTALGRIGFVLPIAAQAVVAAPDLADELLRANALSFRPIRHLAIVLHQIDKVHDDAAVLAFHERMHAGGVPVGFQIRAATLDVLAPLRHVPYEQLHLGRELTHGLREGSAAFAALEALVAIAARADCAIVATGVDGEDTARLLGALGIERIYGPGTGPSRPLHALLERLAPGL